MKKSTINELLKITKNNHDKGLDYDRSALIAMQKDARGLNDVVAEHPRAAAVWGALSAMVQHHISTMDMEVFESVFNGDISEELVALAKHDMISVHKRQLQSGVTIAEISMN